jgi:hypothetical protein
MSQYLPKRVTSSVASSVERTRKYVTERLYNYGLFGGKWPKPCTITASISRIRTAVMLLATLVTSSILIIGNAGFVQTSHQLSVEREARRTLYTECGVSEELFRSELLAN